MDAVLTEFAAAVFFFSVVFKMKYPTVVLPQTSVDGYLDI